jgi:hypothetical protein
VAKDNMGKRKKSDEIVVNVELINDAPAVSLTGISTSGLYRKGDPVTIKANASGRNVSVQFYLYNELLAEDSESPFEYIWEPEMEGASLIRAVATDDRGLTASDSRKLMVSSDCLLLIEPADQTIFGENGNIIITASATSCSEDILMVKFYVNKTTVLEDLTPSPTDGNYEVSFQTSKTGAFQVYAIAEYSDKKIISDTIHFTIGYPESVNSGNIRESIVYPNPSDAGFVFQIILNSPEKFEIEIFNIYGQLVHSFENTLHSETGTYKWDADGMEKGVYSYRIKVSDSIQTGKIIIN